jgi:hypothetical protein
VRPDGPDQGIEIIGGRLRPRCELGNRNQLNGNAGRRRAEMVHVVALGAHAVLRRQPFALPDLRRRARLARFGFGRVVDVRGFAVG